MRAILLDCIFHLTRKGKSKKISHGFKTIGHSIVSTVCVCELLFRWKGNTGDTALIIFSFMPGRDFGALKLHGGLVLSISRFTGGTGSKYESDVISCWSCIRIDVKRFCHLKCIGSFWPHISGHSWPKGWNEIRKKILT